MDDWNTLSLRIGSINGSTHISQRSIKEISLTTAIELKDFEIVADAAHSRDGLINSDLRRLAWPLLMKRNAVNDETVQQSPSSEHKDESQIELDVERSFVHYPIAITADEKAQLRLHLKNVLVRFFREHSNLSYYQGLHDICSVFLLVFEEEEPTYEIFSLFALKNLRDFMLPSIDSSIRTLKIIPELLNRIDKDFFKLLRLDTDPNPFFCLSPIITLFAHDLKTLNSLSLVFDQIISYESIDVLFIIYVVLLIHKKDNILHKIKIAIADDDDEGLSSTDLIHTTLSRFLDNVNTEDINQTLDDIPRYLDKYPLTKLRSFKELNEYSVLKTPSSPNMTYRELIDLQIEQSEEKVTSSRSILLQNLLPKLQSRNLQLLKLTVTIGVISVLLNLFFQRKEPQARLISYANFGKAYLNVGLIQPAKDFWNHFNKPV